MPRRSEPRTAPGGIIMASSNPRLLLVTDLKDAPPSPTPLWRNRDFQPLWAGQVVSSAAGTQPW